MSRIPINLYDKIIYIDKQLNSNKSNIPIDLLNILVSLENIVDNIIINRIASKDDLVFIRNIINKIEEEENLNVFKFRES